MNSRIYTCIVTALILSITSCTNSSDSCDDLEGTITHSTIEITGVESIVVLKRNTNNEELEAIDQSSGANFSNLIIDVDLTWTEEQHRFRASNTIINSFVDWLVAPAVACSLTPYYEEYKPGVSDINIYSDSDFNEEFIAGSDLSMLFSVVGVLDDGSRMQTSISDTLLSARSYYLEPKWVDGVLAVMPDIPSKQVFTIIITLDDGRAYEVRSKEVSLTGV